MSASILSGPGASKSSNYRVLIIPLSNILSNVLNGIIIMDKKFNFFTSSQLQFDFK